MKFDKNWLDKKWVAYTIATCSAVVVYLLLSHINLLFVGIATLYNFISPVFMGLVVAYVMNPLAKFFKRTLFKKMKSLKRRIDNLRAFKPFFIFNRYPANGRQSRRSDPYAGTWPWRLSGDHCFSGLRGYDGADGRSAAPGGDRREWRCGCP